MGGTIAGAIPGGNTAITLIFIIGSPAGKSYLVRSNFQLAHMKFKLVLAVGLLLALSGCRSVRVESSTKNPDIVLFHSNKLLVVGMTRNAAMRQAFETRLQEAFRQAGVETVRSIDLFDVDFTESERSEEELDLVERQLLDRDFDAILFTKVVSSHTHTNLARKLGELGRTYDRFRDDYMLHQGIYYEQDQEVSATDYLAETSLYCICEGKERDLIWRSLIHIANPRNPTRAMREYSDLVLDEMERQQLILGIMG